MGLVNCFCCDDEKGLSFSNTFLSIACGGKLGGVLYYIAFLLFDLRGNDI